MLLLRFQYRRLQVLAHLLLALAMCCIFLMPPGASAQVAPTPTDKLTTAIATKAPIGLLFDLNTRTLLLDKASDKRFQPASLAKVMTAFIVFDQLKTGKLSLAQQASVSVDAWRRGSGPSGAAAMMLAPKANPTVDELLRGMIVASGNDAAITLAEMVAGDETRFATLMNAKARALGAANTQFANATGFSDAQQWTTAADQLTIALALMQEHPNNFSYFNTRDFQWNRHAHKNRNPLLGVDGLGADGFQTGFLEGDGYSLLGTGKIGARRLVLVLAGLENLGDRASEAKRLLGWGFSNFEERTLFEPGIVLGAVDVFGGMASSANVSVSAPLRGLVPIKDIEKFEARIDYLGPIPAPVSKGQELGMLHVRLGDTDLFKAPVVALDDVPSTSPPRRALSVAWDLTLWAIASAFAPLTGGK